MARNQPPRPGGNRAAASRGKSKSKGKNGKGKGGKGKAAAAAAAGVGAAAGYGAMYGKVRGQMIDSGRSSFSPRDVRRNVVRSVAYPAGNAARGLYARLTGTGLPGLKGK